MTLSSLILFLLLLLLLLFACCCYYYCCCFSLVCYCCCYYCLLLLLLLLLLLYFLWYYCCCCWWWWLCSSLLLLLLLLLFFLLYTQLCMEVICIRIFTSFLHPAGIQGTKQGGPHNAMPLMTRATRLKQEVHNQMKIPYSSEARKLFRFYQSAHKLTDSLRYWTADSLMKSNTGAGERQKLNWTKTCS